MNNSPTLRLKRIKSEQTSIYPDFLKRLREFFKLDIFVETGTCFGYTSLAASEIFKEVHTIEISNNLYKNTLKAFENKKNIFAYNGDSAKVLPDILPGLKGSILFWLDGHNAGVNAGRGEVNTPVLEELRTISNLRSENIIILIDDMRVFQPDTWTTPGWIKGYPTVSRIYDEIKKINKKAKFCIYGDISVAVFPPYEIEFSPVIEACTISRMYNGYNFTYDEIIRADRILSKAIMDEKTTLEMLPDDFPSLIDSGFCGHFLLWKGLTKYHNNDFDKAAEMFEKAFGKGCDNWRPKYYLSSALKKSGDTWKASKELEEVFYLEPNFKTFWQKSGSQYL